MSALPEFVETSLFIEQLVVGMRQFHHFVDDVAPFDPEHMLLVLILLAFLLLLLIGLRSHHLLLLQVFLVVFDFLFDYIDSYVRSLWMKGLSL